MLNREWQRVRVITFNSGVDNHGQPRKSEASSRYVQMVLKINTQSNVNSPLFNDVELIGITKDTQITSANQIQANSTKYNVLNVIPSNRYQVILLKEVL